MDVGGGKKECIIEIKNCIEPSGRWMSRGQHFDQSAPRQQNSALASNSHNPAMSPTAC